MYDSIIIFTDGSCKNNGKDCATAGSAVYFPNKELPNKAEKFTLEPITNNRAELYAIYLALGLLDTVKFTSAIIYTDSTYSRDCMIKWYDKWTKNGFKTSKKEPVCNIDIIIMIHNIYKNYPNITIKYTKGHSIKKKEICDDPDKFEAICNYHVDQLAKSCS